VTRITPLSGTSDAAIDGLLDAAFGTDRHLRTAYRIRNGMAWLTDLSFAAHNEAGELVGLMQSWPVALVRRLRAPVPLVMVGPVAVTPTRQGKGIGRKLMDHLVAVADLAGSAPMVMIGDPEYYSRFWGFDATPATHWRVPGPVEQRRLLVRNKRAIALPGKGLLGPRPPR
jgi:predicted N-acetyltransferase YhbS